MMKKLDYNKIMCVIGHILITAFCMVIVIDYTNFDAFNNSKLFYTIILKRVIQLWLPGVILIYLYNANTNLKETNYLIKNKKLPKIFNGYKIAHISDFHNTNSKRLKKSIVQALKNNKPDIIVITGDLIDSRRTNFNTAKEFLESIVSIAPVYYVLGNHESRLRDAQNLIHVVQSTGANVLRNISVNIQKEVENILLIGLDDPGFFIQHESKEEIAKKTDKAIEKIVKASDNYRILLTHRPELIDIYSKYGFNLVFTGHAHGGQIRVPGVGGVIAPGQGIFPKYTKGIYNVGNTKLVVSRGIGNSKFPFRINNRPEIIFVNLENK